MTGDRNRERELAALDREMRRPGTLASEPAAVPLHLMGKMRCDEMRCDEMRLDGEPDGSDGQ